MNQHRLVRVQVVNWGTFDGAWSFRVPRKGLLLTGPSGAGKSSLLDAIASLLVRPAKLRFNAAAQGTDTGDKDRTLVTYVRGAHKRETDDASGEVITAFLRKGATWSAVALTFDDGAGTLTTLIRAFHLRANSAQANDLKSMFVLAPGAVDLLTLKPYVADGIENRRVSNAFPAWDVFSGDAYTGFANKFRRRLGLGSEQAQILLHKTQSAKNLTNLDSLFRDFMLDEPTTFQLADEAVEQFGELSLAHAAVVDARQQVEMLTPLVQQAAELDRLATQQAQVEVEQTHLDTWLASRELGAEQERVAALEPRLAGLEAEAAAAERASSAAGEEVRLRQRAVDGSGGAQLSALEDLLRSLQENLAGRSSRLDQFSGWAQRLGLRLPSRASDVGEFEAALGREGERLAAMRAAHGTENYETQDRRRRTREAEAAVRGELELLRRHGSNLDAALLQMRSMLAERLQTAESSLPFVGELLEVRAEEASWRGAIERVLGSFARTLVLPERHYLAAAEIIDTQHLGARLVYERVGEHAAVRQEDDQHPDSLPAKVMMADGPYAAWVEQRLRRRFDYRCVETASAFRELDRAVTRNGQVKHSTTLHEKDDRRAVGDRSRWVLGFSTEAKEAALEAQLADLATELVEVEARLAELDRAGDQLGTLEDAHRRLMEFNWAEVEPSALQAQIRHTQAELDQLRQDNSDLPRLELELERATQAAITAENTRRKVVGRHDALADQVTDTRGRISALEAQVGAAAPVPEEAAARLAAKADGVAVAHLDRHLRDELAGVVRRVVEHRGRVEGQARRQMVAYKNGWENQAADWGDAVEYLPEYLVRLETLVADRLPEFEQRFFTLLQQQASNNISQLHLQIRRDRREIRSRVDEVNKSLLLTEFSRDEFLQIEVKDRSSPQVDAFLATLNEITEASMADVAGSESDEERRAAEARFVAMKQLLDRLGSSDPGDKAWRERCLDTRQHLGFQAKVQDVDGKQLDVFTGSGGRSGGERQKLVTFCLAAALRFQLAPAGATQPNYALVVIDEAFDKADHTFTQAGLEVFRTFGFQLLLATPMKMLQTIDDYVGGVVMVHNEAGRGSVIQELPFTEDAPPAAEEPTQEALV